MRIAQVAPLFESVPPAGYGGTERVVSYLTEELVRRGHDVTLFASADSRTSARLVSCCPRALRLDRGCRDPLAHHLIMLDMVFERETEFDLIHLHCDYLHFPLSRRSAVPTVSTLHGRLDLPDLAPLYRRFHREPVISISDAQRRPLPRANWVGTVHHGLPRDSYAPGKPAGGYLAFLGRISPEKRLDRAIAIAERAGLPIRIGAKVDPNDREYHEREIRSLLERPGVEFLGEVGEREKRELLGGALALLFPIDWPEPFGLVLIEAMACGTPVIAFPHGSVPEIIEDGVTGFLVNDVAAAVPAVGELHQISRKRCRQEFERRFTDAHMAERYLAIYRQMTASIRGDYQSDEPPEAAEPSEAVV
jgi:glycosyltransferase involved in cell wall biosynthesis